MTTVIRPARREDEDELTRIDAATWSAVTGPAPPPADGQVRRFFEWAALEAVLVAEVGGAAAGYVKVGNSIDLPSHAHVLEIQGLGVDPARQRAGLGRALVEAAVALARERGKHKVTLRVFADNAAARALYEHCGFAVEGVLRHEFLVEGRYVDDVLMARVM